MCYVTLVKRLKYITLFFISFQVFVTIFLSLLVGLLSEYFSNEDPASEQTRDAYLYAGALSVLTMILIVLIGHKSMIAYNLAMQIRVMLTTAIYQKVKLMQ